MTVQLLFRLGQAFDIDLKEFAEDDNARLYAALREVFGDPLFGDRPVREADVRAVAEAGPTAAEAVLRLYKSYRELREDSQVLAEQVASRDAAQGIGGAVFPVEEVRDYLQSESNHFPEIEASAEALWAEAGLDPTDVFGGLGKYLLDVHGISVRVLPVDVMPETTRRFERREPAGMHRRLRTEDARAVPRDQHSGSARRAPLVRSPTGRTVTCSIATLSARNSPVRRPSASAACRSPTTSRAAS